MSPKERASRDLRLAPEASVWFTGPERNGKRAFSNGAFVKASTLLRWQASLACIVEDTGSLKARAIHEEVTNEIATAAGGRTIGVVTIEDGVEHFAELSDT